jgi:hypothetical protein
MKASRKQALSKPPRPGMRFRTRFVPYMRCRQQRLRVPAFESVQRACQSLAIRGTANQQRVENSLSSEDVEELDAARLRDFPQSVGF